MKKLKKLLLIVGGILACALGIVGIFVPGLPTTPFMLLAAALFINGSPKLYRLLISNRYLGPYILNYQKNKGMTPQQKLSSMGLMWFMIIISCSFFIHSNTIRIIVILAGMVGTVVMGWIVPTVNNTSE